jgi:hypothetical protein
MSSSPRLRSASPRVRSPVSPATAATYMSRPTSSGGAAGREKSRGRAR